MSLTFWRRWFAPRSVSSRPARPSRTRLSLETLERRTAPAVFTVNTFDDTVEAVRDGSGRDASGNISLRSAIMAANDLGGAHTILLAEGTYRLSIAPVAPNDDESGNLNIGRGPTQVDVTLEGVSAQATRIDAASLDQALSVGFFATTTVRRLTIENGQGGFGGAVSNSGRLTLTDVVLRNSSASQGGGLFSNGTATLTNVLADSNTANQGGGILNGGTMTVTTTTLSGNYGGQGGGLFNANTLTLSQSTISDNYTAELVGWGGGIFNQHTMTVTNTTIAQNWAATGGAVYIVGSGTTTFVNCTLAANIATSSPLSSAGGIFIGTGGFTPTVRLKNTIVAQNWSEAKPDINGQVTSLGHNLIGDGTGGSGFLPSDLVGSREAPLDPRLGPLQDNGGPTKTMALQAGSMAINAGDAEGAPNLDQRGRRRDSRVDIGAFEVVKQHRFLVIPLVDLVRLR